MSACSARVVISLAVLLGGACGGVKPTQPAQPVRTSITVDSDPGIAIVVAEMVPARKTDLVPILLIHGAGVGSEVFDQPKPGYSLVEDLVAAGHPTYYVDVRGFGGSTKPAAMDQPPEASAPLVTSDEAVRDIAAAITWIASRGHPKVALVGWATGGHWAGMYAAKHPEHVAKLVMLNALYGVEAPWPMRDKLQKLDGYSLRDEASLLRTWDSSIPVADKTQWRDPQVAQLYVDAALATDVTASTRTPPSIRVPSGPLQDAVTLSTGHKLWEASAVQAPTLVIRSELDFWSRPEDVAALQRELPHAEVLTLPKATHLVFVDRPEHGRTMFVDALVKFLAN